MGGVYLRTFDGGGEALGELEGEALGAQHLLLVLVQEVLQRAEAPGGPLEEELARLRLHDLTVLVLHPRVVLEGSSTHDEDDDDRMNDNKNYNKYT